jgi:hypothetical protein
METKFETKFETSLVVEGIFGRNRKVKFEVFTLMDMLDQKPNDQTCTTLAEKKIESIKLRSGFAKVTRNSYEYREVNGMILRTIIPLDQEIVKTYQV